MFKMNDRSRNGRAAVAAAIILGLATPVIAGTVYQWRTEDGTISFTDDQKQIPKRYREEARRSTTKKLSGYERFTPAGKTATGDYGERLQARRTRGEASAAPGVEEGVVAPTTAGPSLITGGTRYGKGSLVVPIDGAGSEPVVIEQERVRAEDSLATRHVRTIRKGDRTLVIEKNELSHRDDAWVPPVTRQ